MALMYSMDLRLSEALSLGIADVDSHEWNNSLYKFHRAGRRLQLRVVKGEGAKGRYVCFPPCLLEVLHTPQSWGAGIGAPT